MEVFLFCISYCITVVRSLSKVAGTVLKEDKGKAEIKK